MKPDELNIEEAMKVLGVVPEMDWEAIRAAYRQKVLLTHPDIVLGEDSKTLIIKTDYLNPVILCCYQIKLQNFMYYLIHQKRYAIFHMLFNFSDY